MDTCYDEQGRAWTFDGAYFTSADTGEMYTEPEFAINVPVAHAEYLRISVRNRIAYGRRPRSSQHYSQHRDQGMAVVLPGKT